MAALGTGVWAWWGSAPLVTETDQGPPPVGLNGEALKQPEHKTKVMLHAEVQMKSSHSIWAKYREASKVIDLHGLFNDYWSSNDHEFTVLGQSLPPTSPRISD